MHTRYLFAICLPQKGSGDGGGRGDAFGDGARPIATRDAVAPQERSDLGVGVTGALLGLSLCSAQSLKLDALISIRLSAHSSITRCTSVIRSAADSGDEIVTKSVMRGTSRWPTIPVIAPLSAIPINGARACSEANLKRTRPGVAPEHSWPYGPLARELLTVHEATSGLKTPG